MEAPPPPLVSMLGAPAQEEEEEISFFLASLATATTSSSSNSSRNTKATLSLLPASPDFMAFQGFVSLGVSTSGKVEKEGRVARKHRLGG